MFGFSPSSERVKIRLRPLGNAAYVACLPLLCQGSKWLSGKSIDSRVRLYYLWRQECLTRIQVESQLDPGFFFCGFISHSLNKNITDERLLSLPVNNIKPLKVQSCTKLAVS